MGFFDFFRRLFNRRQISLQDEQLLNWLGIDTNTKAIQEVTYYTCVKMLSETMGKLPMHYFRSTDKGTIRAEPTDASKLLKIRPNPYMTPTTLWSTTELNCQEYGNAFIWINREIRKGARGRYNIEYDGLYPMSPKDVTIWIDDIGIFGNKGALHYEYMDPRTGQDYMFDSDEVMHFKTWYSKDGITGEPVRTILKDTIRGAASTQSVTNNLYKNGLTASMALQYTGDLDDERIKMLQKKFANKLTGPENAGKVIPIPAGMTLTPLPVKLTDAQFFELKKYSALQIAAAFGIKPNQINNYDKSSYNSSETQHLDFLVDTMSYRLKSYEEEINAKMLLPSQQDAGYFFRFNEKAMLRSDSKTQMDTLAEAVNNGIYTPNEARSYLQLECKDGGDILMCNGNYIPITAVSEKGGNDGTD